MIPEGWINQQTSPAPASTPVARIDFGANYKKFVKTHFGHLPHTYIATKRVVGVVDVNYFARYQLMGTFIPWPAYLDVVINKGGSP